MPSQSEDEIGERQTAESRVFEALTIGSKARLFRSFHQMKTILQALRKEEV
jgi:hypothetical protein